MGNRNANENEEEDNHPNGNNEQVLIQNNNNNNNNINKIEAPSVKKIFAVKNPFSIRKTTISLEKDAGPTNQYYIKFNYDSLVNFNCYINFEVTKNNAKPLLPKETVNSDNYILAYNPSINFTSKSIAIKNLPKGENMEFFEKEAVIDIDYFKKNISEKNDNKEKVYDLSIELVPIFEEYTDEKDKTNEVVFVSLCTLEQEEIGKHPHSIKIEAQKLKTYGMWIDLHDIFNSSLDNGECLICCTALRNTIFLPCRHACTCNTCAHSLKMRNSPCPICKNTIKDLLILEVDEKVNQLNIDDDEEIIDEIVEKQNDENIEINIKNNNPIDDKNENEDEENEKIYNEEE